MNSSSSAHRSLVESDAQVARVRAGVLTISDSRTLADDQGGNAIVRMLEGAGHIAVQRALVRDEPHAIRAVVRQWCADPQIQAIITTGGTGIAKRDSTVDVIRRQLSTELVGFGELFRSASVDEVGASAMLSRAVAGLVTWPAELGGETFVFTIPGSLNAVETAMRVLINPELSHLVWERRR